MFEVELCKTHKAHAERSSEGLLRLYSEFGPSLPRHSHIFSAVAVPGYWEGGDGGACWG
jgi:hypothetical protein